MEDNFHKNNITKQIKCLNLIFFCQLNTIVGEFTACFFAKKIV